MNELIDFVTCGPTASERWGARGLVIPHAPHFVVTDFYMQSSRLSHHSEIVAAPALTHLGTGCRVSQRLESVKQARKIAVILEMLPIPWDSMAGEIVASSLVLPSALQHWLSSEIRGHPRKEARAR